MKFYKIFIFKCDLVFALEQVYYSQICNVRELNLLFAQGGRLCHRLAMEKILRLKKYRQIIFLITYSCIFWFIY
jgi:hypothetical protein